MTLQLEWMLPKEGRKKEHAYSTIHKEVELVLTLTGMLKVWRDDPDTAACNKLHYPLEPIAILVYTTYFEYSMINLPSPFNGMSVLPARSRNISGGPYVTIFAKQIGDFLSPSSELSLHLIYRILALQHYLVNTG